MKLFVLKLNRIYFDTYISFSSTLKFVDYKYYERGADVSYFVLIQVTFNYFVNLANSLTKFILINSFF